MDAGFCRLGVKKKGIKYLNNLYCFHVKMLIYSISWLSKIFKILQYFTSHVWSAFVALTVFLVESLSLAPLPHPPILIN